MRSALEWAQVRALAADGISQREIATRLGMNRRTVARLLGSEEPPRYRVHRGVEVARYPRSYEQGVWLPPPIMRPEPPAALTPLAVPRLTVAPPELADYAELCA